MRATRESALRLTNDYVLQLTQAELTSAEITILQDAWDGLPYRVTAEKLGLKETLVRVSRANDLFKKVARAFGVDKIEKRDYKYFLTQRLEAMQSDGIDPMPVIGGELPRSDGFCGRAPEIAWLEAALSEAKCINLVGPTGIGKTALVSRVVGNYDGGFSQCIWRNVSYQPTRDDLLEDLLYHLKGANIETRGGPFHQLVKFLLDNKYLIVLDGVTENSFEEYHELFSRLVQEAHRSCLLITSKAPIPGLKDLENSGYLVYSYKMTGLKVNGAYELIESQGLSKNELWDQLISSYTGNPMILLAVLSMIKEYYDGDIAAFIEKGTILPISLFDKNFSSFVSNLSPLDQRVVLFISQEACTTDSIVDSIGASRSDVLESIIKMLDLSLIEVDKESNKYCIPPVMSKFFQKAVQA